MKNSSFYHEITNCFQKLGYIPKSLSKLGQNILQLERGEKVKNGIKNSLFFQTQPYFLQGNLPYVSRASDETNLCYFLTLQVMLDVIYGENGLIEVVSKLGK